MYEYREHAPHQLSGGQKQRVAIAGIIAMRPELYCAGRAHRHAGPQGPRGGACTTIRKLNREFGITVVLITHYMDEAAQADRVVVMDDGKIMLDGTAREVFSHVEQLKCRGPGCAPVHRARYMTWPEAGYPARQPHHRRGGVRRCRQLCWTHDHWKDRQNVVQIIKTEHLTYIYIARALPLKRSLSDDVNMEIEKGEFVGVIGHTGSGKSTLIQHLNGLLQPTSGKVYIDGEDIWADPKEIRRVPLQGGAGVPVPGVPAV